MVEVSSYDCAEYGLLHEEVFLIGSRLIHVSCLLDLHLHRAPAFTRFAPCEFVDGRIVGDFARLVQFELLAGAGTEVDRAGCWPSSGRRSE